MSLIDCHAHLDEFGDPAPVLDRTAAASVGGIVAVGINTATSRRVRLILEDFRPSGGRTPPAAGTKAEVDGPVPSGREERR